MTRETGIQFPQTAHEVTYNGARTLVMRFCQSDLSEALDYELDVLATLCHMTAGPTERPPNSTRILEDRIAYEKYTRARPDAF